MLLKLLIKIVEEQDILNQIEKKIKVPVGEPK